MITSTTTTTTTTTILRTWDVTSNFDLYVCFPSPLYPPTKSMNQPPFGGGFFTYQLLGEAFGTLYAHHAAMAVKRANAPAGQTPT